MMLGETEVMGNAETVFLQEQVQNSIVIYPQQQTNKTCDQTVWTKSETVTAASRVAVFPEKAGNLCRLCEMSDKSGILKS